MSDIGTTRTATVHCTNCGAQNDPKARTCESCGTPLPGPDGDRQELAGGIDTSEAPPTYPAGERTDGFRDGAAPETPVEAHPDRFEPGEAGTLADQADLTDAEGEDIRQYTGEPVETEDGWVIPQQQNVAGKDNIAGGGEWPDPETPPVQPTNDGEDPAEED